MYYQQESYGQQYQQYGQQQQQPYGQPYAQPYVHYPPPQEPHHNESSSSYNHNTRLVGEKFPETSRYRDLFWAILFIIHLGGLIALCVFGSIKYSNGAKEQIVDISTPEFRQLLLVVGICALSATFLSVLWLNIMKRFPRALIIGTFVATIIMWAAFGILLLAQGAMTAGIIMLVFAGLFTFFYFNWRSRIPFATTMLQTVARLTNEYSATSTAAYLSLLVHIGYSVFFWWSLSVSQYITDNNVGFLLIIFILSYYWTTQVIKNIVHVTVSGTFATWYFLKGNNNMPENPTIKSFKRSITTSFGSICLGSLLVAILETLRTLIRYARAQRDNIIAFCADCILGIIESLLRYFNLYAFTQVAIYGKSYVQAAKDTWELVHTHGVEAIINDNLIVNVLQFGALFGGALCAIIGAIVGSILANDYYTYCIVIGFVIGYAFLSVVMEVVQSGVATIFVCFAEDREALRRNDPFLFEKFMSTYHNIV